MTAIDQRGELDSRWPAERTDRVHGRTHGASSEKHIIDDDDGTTLERRRKLRCFYDRKLCARSDVVAVHGDVDHARIDLDLLDLSNKASDSAGNFIATRWNSGQNNRAQIRIALDDLVRDPPQRTANRFRVHDREGGRRRTLF